MADNRLLHMQDGSIQYEVKLTGCLSTSILSEGEGVDPTHGTLIGPLLNAQLHQHYFCVRLDMAVDDPEGGAALTVSEVSHHRPRSDTQCQLGVLVAPPQAADDGGSSVLCSNVVHDSAC